MSEIQKIVIVLLLVWVTSPAIAADSPLAKQILELNPQADTNGDGVLSPEEEASLSQRILIRFPRADADGNGTLSDAEKQALLKRAIARAKKAESPATPTNNNSNRKAPDHADVKYAEHERNVFDLWLAESTEATPLAIYIHGGGFRAGSKEKLSPADLSGLLEAGISVAAINYRLIPAAPLPTPHHDARRALQFLRAKAGDWNIDKDRVAVFGGSAGAQISMWLAYSDDMAKPNSEEAVERESTRVTCVATSGGQTSMEREFWIEHMRPLLGDQYDYEKIIGRGQSQKAQEAGRLATWGAETAAEVDAKTKRHSALRLISADDPPIFMKYGMPPAAKPPGDSKKVRGWLIHHSFFGVALKEKADALKLEAHLRYPGAESNYESIVEFFADKLANQ